MISNTNAQGSVKIRLACSRVLFLIISSSNIVVRLHNGYTKGDKYFFFIKVSVANVLLKLNYLLSRVDSIQKDHI